MAKFYFKQLFLAGVFCLCNSQVFAQLHLEQVASGVWVHFAPLQKATPSNHGAIANIGFIVGDKCVAVIDTGGSPKQGHALKQAIRKITPKPVCYVINTHAHPDHIYGNIAFQQDGVQFVGHHNLAANMAARSPYYIERSQREWGIQLSAKHSIPPDLAVQKTMRLNLGGRQLLLSAHQTAHTNNDLTIFDIKTNTVWLGDLLFIGHIPVLGGSLLGWLDVLQGFKSQKWQTVIPGHGRSQVWRQDIIAEQKYLQTLLVQIRLALSDGVFLQQAQKTIGYSEQSKWKLFKQFHQRNVAAAFVELEWE